MTVIHLDQDLDAKVLTLVAEFDAPIERVWELWADPRRSLVTRPARSSTATCFWTAAKLIG